MYLFLVTEYVGKFQKNCLDTYTNVGVVPNEIDCDIAKKIVAMIQACNWVLTFSQEKAKELTGNPGLEIIVGHKTNNGGRNHHSCHRRNLIAYPLCHISLSI